MRFYILREPSNCSDYEFVWVNGEGGQDVLMPGVDCSVCGNTRGLEGGLLPYRLPAALEKELHELDGWPISETEHRALRERVERGLRELHPDMPPMPPGPSFPPIGWMVPSRPDGDLFWGAGLVVSARLARALEAIDASGFALIPIDTVMVGEGSPADRPPIPTSGEPDDLVDLATRRLAEGEPYFVLSVLTEGSLNSRMQKQPACEGCGYAEVKRGSVWEDWEIWEDSIWPGTDTFHFPTTNYVVITERIAKVLDDLNVGNCELTPLVDGEYAFQPSFREFPPQFGFRRWFPDWMHRLTLRMYGLD